MSHHLDSPLARRDPRLNITDQYVFDDRDATVFVMNVRTSLGGDTTPQGFHEEGRYEFRVHLDDAPIENLAFRFAFDRADERGAQLYRVFRLEGEAAAADTAIGVEVARGRTGQQTMGADGVQVWAGRALDPFYLDLNQLAAVDRLVIGGEDAEITGALPGTASNTFAGSTVWTVVLRVPLRDSALFNDRMIRVWSTTRLATDTGGWRQVGRAGLPMIWPIFRDATGEEAGNANGTHPNEDLVQSGKRLRDRVTAAVQRLGSTARPEAYALAVVQRILPDTLPYQVGTPAIFGFTDFNGRLLGDNAPEVMFSLVTNTAVSTGLPAARTAGTRSETFPYVVPA
ncbi:DUF4331 domain-containing protein [Actinoplanes hulinensis]|uniref:DUF4331 domain-containing protein n=1 Tax=Actinoplanes hulinensis TaxID=1144547 RepID=A0ABS7BDL2_9ACTN|nr:DUF4331 family protein [Actinoplanes hulinensis]MBW6439110.1 DUF4331 domain-containing protein [Actinoplanes hulinensis]